jgi:hypothetical protein
MKTFQKILCILMVCAAVFLCNSCVEKNHLANVDAIVIAELERLSVVPEADAEIRQYELPEDVDVGADWGLKTIVCEEGGYDLHPYAGKTVTLTSVDIKGTCQGEKIQIWVVSDKDAIACAYLTVREDSSAAPGVWPVNSDQCAY